ncbi:MAG: antibiotic biosynthesis monooxygenase [Sphingosinicella sp.]|nr:antibiotic biosynthesis monooxygenase [Sphingosinicella sp.]
MIARRWHGRVPSSKSEEYLRLMREVALPDYGSTEGNRGAWCLHRQEGDIIHVEMFTLWEGERSIRAFAGENIALAKYYDFDADFLLEKEPHVTHFDAEGGLAS